MNNKENKRPGCFPLRLPLTMRLQANDLAHREGLSLNQFISLAVAEKITRLEHSSWIREVSLPESSHSGEPFDHSTGE